MLVLIIMSKILKRNVLILIKACLYPEKHAQDDYQKYQKD